MYSLITERTESQSDSLVKVSSRQHHREQLPLVNQRWDTDLPQIRENIKGRDIVPVRTRDNQPCNGLRQAISGGPGPLRVIGIVNTCWSASDTGHVLGSSSLTTIIIMIVTSALTISRCTGRRRHLSGPGSIYIDRRLPGDCVLNLYDCSWPSCHGKITQRWDAHAAVISTGPSPVLTLEPAVWNTPS